MTNKKKNLVKFTHKDNSYAMDKSKNLYKVDAEGNVAEDALPQHPVFLNARLAGEKRLTIAPC